MKNSISSKKLNKFRSSPLIIAIAVIEAIVLVAVSTFAWFTFGDKTTISSEVLTVEPDSGLDIDFNVADMDTSVDINKYIKDFKFEPVTSLDGRNIFVPTTGTKNSVETSGIKFREATVNDMNSKYINVDFTLTNTNTSTDEPMDVWLNSNSYFNVNNDTRGGKALRLALYSNDGTSGDVDNEIIDEDLEIPGGNEEENFYIFFKNNATKDKWTKILSENDYTKSYGFQDGAEMTHIEGTDYYYIDVSKFLRDDRLTFLKFRNGDTSDHNPQTYQFGRYDESQAEERDKNIKFNKYYYEFQLDSNGAPKWNHSVDKQYVLINGPIEFEDGERPEISGDTTAPSTTKSTTVYFYNTLGWEEPHAYIYKDDGDNDKIPENGAHPGIKMTKIAGDLYYHTFSAQYDHISFNDGRTTGTQDNHREQSVDTEAKNGYIYTITTLNKTADYVDYYDVICEPYETEEGDSGYPVISPGASAGFQRPYAPVLDIMNESGVASTVIPAFASSIEDYSYGSGEKLFSIKPGQTISLSMIIWLEGTDPDCIKEHYANFDVDLKLIFATKQYPEETFEYVFLDKTKESWVIDKVITETDIPYKPVMQLYDLDNNKGYLMREVKDPQGNVIKWSVTATKELLDRNVSFRRVNPLDEDEIWNFWDAGKISDYSEYAYADANSDGVMDTAIFSAFADGLPVEVLKKSTDTEAVTQRKSIVRSCGGLWGEHNTKIVTIYDATDGQWLNDSSVEYTYKGEKVKSKSALSIYYECDGQTIEYKASGADYNSFYHFVIPEKAISSDAQLYVSRYYNFKDKYAINLPVNKSDLTYHRTWSIGKYGGSFYQIGGKSVVNDCYWGSDMLYVQIDVTFADEDSSSGDKYFYGQPNTMAGFLNSSNDNNFYKTLVKNDNLKNKLGDYSLACVVPNDHSYDRYLVQRVNPNNGYDVWTKTNDIVMNATTVDGYKTNTLNKNICKLNSFIDNSNLFDYDCYNDELLP